MHSHSYRDADPFKDNSVLVIGCGASGLDISFGVSKVAKKVNINVFKIIKIFNSKTQGYNHTLICRCF